MCVCVQCTRGGMLFWPDPAFTVTAAKCGTEVAMWREQAAAAGCGRTVVPEERRGFTARRWWAVLSPEQRSGESPRQAERGWLVCEISLAKRVCKGRVLMGEEQRCVAFGKRADRVSWLPSCSSWAPRSLCLHHPSKTHVMGESVCPTRFAEGMEGQKG